ncbi:MAG: hypothetical protein NTX00_04840 [Candidatus Parcubacteria bacterium]|nr:hypothetical protein [Candidatus Parcubacteria bacterium]
MAHLLLKDVHYIRFKICIAQIAKKFKVKTDLLREESIISGSKKELLKLQKALQKQCLPQGKIIILKSKKQ